jgi:hypothetical protein
MAGTRILWADDDAAGILSAIAEEFQRCRCQVDIALDLESALSRINEDLEHANGYATVLADIVLPKKTLAPGISRYLGVGVAQAAAGTGRVRRVGILTVVSWAELAQRFEKLRREFTQVEFRYFNKADLLYQGRLQQLSDFVRVDCRRSP